MDTENKDVLSTRTLKDEIESLSNSKSNTKLTDLFSKEDLNKVVAYEKELEDRFPEEPERRNIQMVIDAKGDFNAVKNEEKSSSNGDYTKDDAPSYIFEGKSRHDTAAIALFLTYGNMIYKAYKPYAARMNKGNFAYDKTRTYSSNGTSVASYNETFLEYCSLAFETFLKTLSRFRVSKYLEDYNKSGANPTHFIINGLGSVFFRLLGREVDSEISKDSYNGLSNVRADSKMIKNIEDDLNSKSDEELEKMEIDRYAIPNIAKSMARKNGFVSLNDEGQSQDEGGDKNDLESKTMMSAINHNSEDGLQSGDTFEEYYERTFLERWSDLCKDERLTRTSAKRPNFLANLIKNILVGIFEKGSDTAKEIFADNNYSKNNVAAYIKDEDSIFRQLLNDYDITLTEWLKGVSKYGYKKIISYLPTEIKEAIEKMIEGKLRLAESAEPTCDYPVNDDAKVFLDSFKAAAKAISEADIDWSEMSEDALMAEVEDILEENLMDGIATHKNTWKAITSIFNFNLNKFQRAIIRKVLDK